MKFIYLILFLSLINLELVFGKDKNEYNNFNNNYNGITQKLRNRLKVSEDSSFESMDKYVDYSRTDSTWTGTKRLKNNLRLCLDKCKTYDEGQAECKYDCDKAYKEAWPAWSLVSHIRSEKS
ncbi:hypothetical protein DLAC_02536 [Tieghemostelium lacteum]|uniref:Uncharacterized protein n=1 Tax=Tieghemostelium lacteum TaxID=361077 RepID=A0A152A347_TIELA|nr:hypothetical protein DLAC_02536 [Tieghemostelium lacteum]|eukprot:KYR00525.1 hypothetical protein DLAC_02536 [Tieghemostelium lacteum]